MASCKSTDSYAKFAIIRLFCLFFEVHQKDCHKCISAGKLIWTTLQNTHHARHKENNRQVLGTAINQICDKFLQNACFKTCGKNRIQDKNIWSKTFPRCIYRWRHCLFFYRLRHKEEYRKREKANGAKPPYHLPYLVMLLKNMLWNMTAYLKNVLLFYKRRISFSHSIATEHTWALKAEVPLPAPYQSCLASPPPAPAWQHWLLCTPHCSRDLSTPVPAHFMTLTLAACWKFGCLCQVN